MTKEDLLEIFCPFVDPATPIDIEITPLRASIKIIRDGEERDYFLNTAAGDIIARHDGSRKYISINSLLASNEFANLKAFAATQQRTLSDLKGGNFLPPNLLIQGTREGVSGLKVLDSAAQNQSIDKIKVILLDGPAGVGKTHLLKQLTLIRAENYQLHANIPPLLYVSSRGRRMSNLRDALAGATQLLKARFTFEQVPILAKRGLLQLVIDGFDELVDSEGYQDAWHALREFLEELGTGGVCILAGRDTFFDEQGFRNRLASISTRLDLIQAHLLPVTPKIARGWLADHEWPIEEIEREETTEILREDSYALRPFFLTTLAEAKSWSAVLEKVSARSYLIDRFLMREASLITTKIVQFSNESAYACLRNLFEEAALDMAERESEEVDVEYLSFLTDIAFSGSLESDDVKKLQHKSGSFALLEKSTQDRLRKFPHSEIRNYFLSCGIIRSVSEGTIPLVLRRGVLGSDFLEVFVDVVEEGGGVISSFFENIEKIIKREISGDRLLYNIGAILLSSLGSQDASIPRALNDLTINEAVLYGSISESSLEHISVGRLDVRGCDLSRVGFTDCDVASLVVDEYTKFGNDKPNVHMIQKMIPEGTQVLRSTYDIDKWFEDNSIKAERSFENDLPLVKLFDRICRRSLRQFYLSPGGDDPSAMLLEDWLWPEVSEILKKFDRIQYVDRQMGGPKLDLIHIKEPMALLIPAEEDIDAQQIRREIVNRARILHNV